MNTISSTTKEIKIAIYIRVSTNYQIDKDSLPMQREDLSNYCKYILNTDNFVIFEDAGFSGKNTDRPGFQDMMYRIRKKEFTHILVWKIDRISRNLLDFSNMYEELKKNNVVFISKNEQFDTSSAMGEAMLKIILVFAELERKLTSERVTATMISRATKGLWNGANVPLGYKWDTKLKYPVPDNTEKEVVKLVFDTYLKVKSCNKLAELFNSTNIKTKRGGYWSSKTVNDILRNPFYIGTYRYNYRESGGGKKKDESEWIIVENNHEPIIDKELWNACQHILNINGDFNKSIYRSNKEVHIFSKKLVCSKCGNGFVASKDRPRKDGYRPSRYRCSGQTRKKICDAKIVSDITIGEFIISFLRNIIIAGKMKGITLEQLEDTILSSNAFSKVSKINREDLEMLYTALYQEEFSKALYVADIQESNKDVKSDIITSQLNSLNLEEKRQKNALIRLDDLYLYSDKSIEKNVYIQKKNEINTKLKEIKEKTEQYYKMYVMASEIKDMQIVLEFEKFLFNDMFINNKFEFDKYIRTINNKVIKDLIDMVIECVALKDTEVTEIKLNNGLRFRFEY